MALSLDKFRDVDLVIDKANDNFIQRQFVSQADYKGRTLTVQVTNNGEIGEIPGLFLNLRWQNQASGLTDLTGFVLIDKENSVFRIEYPEHMMTPGQVVASIQLIHDGKTLHMKQFELTVQKLAGEAVGIVGKAEYSALVAVLSDANKFRTDIDTLDVRKADRLEVDQKIDSLQTGTYDTLNSTDELNSKYPNGAPGSVVVLESDGITGYQYTFTNGSWKKGAMIQAQGVPDKAIKLRKLGVDITQTKSSNNLIDLTNVFWDKYVNYNSGSESSNSNFCYAKVPVESGENYEIIGTNQQGCFFNSSGAYVSGWINISGFPKVIPENVAYICQTFAQSEIAEGYISKIGESFHLSNVLDANAVFDESIPTTKISVPPFLDGGLNLFDREKIESGKYVDFNTGKLTTNAAYSASDFIFIDFRQRWIVEGTTEQLAFYDSLKRYIGGVRYAYELPNTNLPKNARFVRLTIRNEQIASVKLRPVQNLNPKWIDDSFAGQVGALLNVPGAATNVVSVAKSGGDFNTLRSALENTGWGTLIKVYNSISLEDEYTVSEIKSTNFVGFKLDNNRTLQGVGNVEITANLDPSLFSEEDIRRVATLSVVGNAKLKNLKVIGENVRYACHIDYGNTKSFSADNVYFLKQNTGIYCQGLGGGTYSGQNHAYKNCTFETKWTGESDIPVSYHTNNNFSEPSFIKFEDCRFSTNGSQYELRFGGMKSNQTNVVELIGNRLSSILVKEERLDGVGLDFLIRGRGNRALTFKQQSQSGTASAQYDFVEEITVV